ncbi:hypothetical protein, partial [Vibrio panuliri]|uniref:hypothetical protein n=1 Tax=Vibrio panuliri TaxID=1381081 RepID=UPI001C0CEE32
LLILYNSNQYRVVAAQRAKKPIVNFEKRRKNHKSYIFTLSIFYQITYRKIDLYSNAPTIGRVEAR